MTLKLKMLQNVDEDKKSYTVRRVILSWLLIILEYRVSQGKKLDTRKLKLHPGNLDQRKKVNKNLPTSLTKFFFFNNKIIVIEM